MTSAEMLRSYVERIERLEGEIATLNGDKSDVYTEAKGKGFDVPALKAVIGQRRKIAKDPIKFEDFENMVDVYRNTLESGTVVAHTRARAAKRTATHKPGVVPEAGGGTGSAAPADPIPPSPAGSESPAGSPLPATLAPPELASVPAGDAKPKDGDDIDAGCEARDGHDSFVLAHQVASGWVPHPNPTAVDAPLELPSYLKIGTPENAAIRGGGR